MEYQLPEDVEQELAAFGVDLRRPHENECLFCFVWRMVELHGCDGLDWAKRYLAIRAPGSRGRIRTLEAAGGYCDCEIIMNVVTPNDPMWLPGYDEETDGYDVSAGEDKPACLGIGKGSTSPCALWNGGGAFRRQNSPY